MPRSWQCHHSGGTELGEGLLCIGLNQAYLPAHDERLELISVGCANVYASTIE